MAAVLLKIALNIAKKRDVHERSDSQQNSRTAPDHDCEDHCAEHACSYDTELATAIVVVFRNVGREIEGFAERVERQCVDDLTRRVCE